MADINELERKVNTLWQQDYPNQKKVLDLETKLLSLEKKVNAPISLPIAPKFNNEEQIKFNQHLLGLLDSLKVRLVALETKKVKKSQLEV